MTSIIALGGGGGGGDYKVLSTRRFCEHRHQVGHSFFKTTRDMLFYGYDERLLSSPTQDKKEENQKDVYWNGISKINA